MHLLAGKRVLVVGATRGIGKAVVVRLAADGASVAAAGRRADLLEVHCAELDPPAIPITCDVRDPVACRDVVAEAVATLGGLDALVYAAGVSLLAPLARADADLWHAVLDTNVIGASLVCQAALPSLRASQGRAVFIGSSSVGRPFPGLAAYAASKAALDELVRGYRAENPDVSFTNVVVGPTAGTEFASQWDGDLAGEMFPFWERHGYLTGGTSMEVAQVAQVVSSVLLAPVSMWSVAVHAHDHEAEPAVR